jgi:hypothetical protein
LKEINGNIKYELLGVTEDISIPVSSDDAINVGQLSLSRASAGIVNGAKQ